MLSTHEQHGRTKLIATVVAVLVVAGIVVVADHIKAKGHSTVSAFTQSTTTTPKSSSNTAPSTTSSSSSASTSTTSSTNTSGFKDGTYAASSSYFVPSGDQSIEVSVTLKNGVITDSSVQNSESDPTSASFQEGFASNYKGMVVGQKISGLQLSTVSGASDTTQGFNDALSQIASKAQA